MAVTITIDGPKNGVAMPHGTANFLVTGSYLDSGGTLASAASMGGWTSFGLGPFVPGTRNIPPTTAGAAWEFSCMVPGGAGSNPFFVGVQVFGPSPVVHFIQVSVAARAPGGSPAPEEK